MRDGKEGFALSCGLEKRSPRFTGAIGIDVEVVPQRWIHELHRVEDRIPRDDEALTDLDGLVARSVTRCRYERKRRTESTATADGLQQTSGTKGLKHRVSEGVRSGRDFVSLHDMTRVREQRLPVQDCPPHVI